MQRRTPSRPQTEDTLCQAWRMVAGICLVLGCTDGNAVGPAVATPERTTARCGSSQSSSAAAGACEANVASIKPPAAPLPQGGYNCPDIACASTPFALTFAATNPWDASAYFFRVALDGGPPSVCQIAFDARVAGAVLDTCNISADPNGSGDRGFSVDYRYDEAVRQIDGMTFTADVSQVDLELLTSDDRPALAEVHHTVSFTSTALGESPCTQVCKQAAPLVVPVREAALGPEPDAGLGTDAGGLGPDAAP